MNFSLTEEQQLLADSAQRFVREHYAMDQRRARMESEAGYSDELWSQMAQLGWLGLLVPEEHGGVGGGAVEAMVLMEAFGRGLVLEPYLPSAILGVSLLAHASAEQRARVLPALAAGEHKLAFAYVEAQSGYDLFDIETTAAPRDGGYVLRGEKSVVLAAQSADTLIVTARTAGESRDVDGLGLFLVPRTAPGVHLRAYRTIDGLRAAEVSLRDVTLGADAVVGEPGGAWPQVEFAAQAAMAALCAEAVGAMAQLVESTNDYLKTREQFGRPIGKFQVLQHQMVDMLIASEEARSVSLVATLRIDDPDAQERRRAVSAAKHLVGKHALSVGECSVQLHGGMGMTDEMSIGHYFKRLAMIDVMFGDHAYHLDRYAGL